MFTISMYLFLNIRSNILVLFGQSEIVNQNMGNYADSSEASSDEVSDTF
jgi:hypothetical protein